MTAVSNQVNHPRMTPYGSRFVEPKGKSEKLRAMALSGIRRAGQVSAALRIKPEYLVIGTKRGGTTSMARWLLDHPDVSPLWPARETRKGTYYFDVNYGRGEEWYLSHFPTAAEFKIRQRQHDGRLTIGEATPYYLHHPHAAIRARRLVPEAKIIALLRNPMERAYGHWMERTRNGVETLSFEDAIGAEPERLAGEEERMLNDPSYVSFAHQHFSYLDQGRYARGLGRWLEAYPSDQILIIRSEDMYADPATIYGQTLEFLGLATHEPDDFAAWNFKPKDPLDDRIMKQLTNALSGDIAELEELISRPMDWL